MGSGNNFFYFYFYFNKYIYEKIIIKTHKIKC